MTEEDIRSQSCYFIREVGIKLNLPQLTIATAIVFFHKYAKRNSIIQENPFMISTSCIFLAGKVEETPKKLQDVISVSYHIRFKRQLKIDSQEYLEIRESVLKRECRILQTIGFRFTVEHPYKYILKYTGDIKGSREIAQTAWNFVNDSLRTTMCLTHTPQIIAAATVYLAARYHESDIPTTTDSNNRKCFLQFKVEELEETSNKILDLYVSAPEANQQNSQQKELKRNPTTSNPSTLNHRNSLPHTASVQPHKSSQNTSNSSIMGQNRQRLVSKDDGKRLQGNGPIPSSSNLGGRVYTAPPPVQNQPQIKEAGQFDALFESISEPSTTTKPKSRVNSPSNISIIEPKSANSAVNSAVNSARNSAVNSPQNGTEVEVINIRPKDGNIVAKLSESEGNTLVMRHREVSPSHRFSPY